MQQVIKVGTVSSVDEASATVRVTFPDRSDMVSGDLPVLRLGGLLSLPAVGEPAVCLFLGDSLGAGFYLGSFYAAGQSVPTAGANRTVLGRNMLISGNLEVTGTLKHGGVVE